MTRRPEEVLGSVRPIPTYRGAPAAGAADVAGVDLSGRAIEVKVRQPGRWSVLVFLSSSCGGCADLWAGLAEMGAGVRAALGGSEPARSAVEVAVVAVGKDPGEDDPAALARLAEPGTVVVLSSAAWRDYQVGGPPFFSVVDGDAGRVVTEGLPWGKDAVADAVRRARSSLR